MGFQVDTLTQLEACGVRQAHLEALLRFLRCQANGSFAWHAHQGALERCELKMIYSGKPHVVHGVSQAMRVGDEE